jgi:hypothetical protein
MKKINLLIMFCALTGMSFAQLKVSNTGKVGINIGTSTPSSNLSVNAVGNSNSALFVKGATNGIWAERGEGVQVIPASDFRAGIYLYGLIADGSQVDMKRMILTE